MTAPSEDAVGVARAKVLSEMYVGNASPERARVLIAEHEAALDALIRAVRAECAAKVRYRERKAFREGAMWVRDLANPCAMNTSRIEREAAVLYPEAKP